MYVVRTGKAQPFPPHPQARINVQPQKGIEFRAADVLL